MTHPLRFALRLPPFRREGDAPLARPDAASPPCPVVAVTEPSREPGELPHPLHRFADVEPPPPGRLLIDARIVEMDNAERGISRYVQGLGKALLAARPGAVRFLFDPNALPSPFRAMLPPDAIVTDLAATVRREPIAYFVQACHFILHLPFDHLYPPVLLDTKCRVGAVFYDAIPWRMPREYLKDPHAYAAYFAKLDALRDADLLFAISRHAREEACSLLGLPHERVVFLGGGVDDERWLVVNQRRPAGVPPGPFWLCVGGPDPRKNLPRLFQGYALYRRKVSEPVPLVVACAFSDEARRRTEERIAAAGLRLGDEVVLTGHVSDGELARLYTDCRALIMPSTLEGLGLPILEAYHFGRPALGSDRSGLVELVHPDFRFDPFAPETIAEALRRLETEPELAARSVAFGRKILNDYAWPLAAERLLSALAERGVRIVADAVPHGAVSPSGEADRQDTAGSPPSPETVRQTDVDGASDGEPGRKEPDASGERRFAFVSYAQNFEDVLLWRVLKDVTPGRYIDLGAQDPVRDSVSLGFYERGWRGVHVEPVPAYAEALRRARPDEMVIEAAVAAAAGTLAFHEVVGTGLGTAVDDLAEAHAAAGWTVARHEVKAITLDEVFAAAGGEPIHWLKIDVEGMETAVLEGWRRPDRPWVVVIEDVHPLAPQRRSGACDAAMEARGYRRCLFDGLNSFWVHRDHAELAERLAYGVSLWDDAVLAEPSFVPLARLLMERLLAARRETLHAQRRMQHEHALAEAWRARHDQARAELAAMEAERAALAQRAAELDARLAAVLASRTWRWTEPLRRGVATIRKAWR